MKSEVLCLVFLFTFNFLSIGQDHIENNLTNHPSSDRYASYSPDGKQIIFESDREGQWDIFLMSKDGNNLKRVTYHTADDRRPSWHPNGQSILFESQRNGKFELYSYHIQTGQIMQLTNTKKGELIFASYSPDGKQIAVSCIVSDTASIILTLNDKGQVADTLVQNSFRNFYPKWSNDGTRLVYFSRQDTDNQDDEIYLMDLNANQSTRLTNWPTHNFCPSWSPDNSRIVYVTSMADSRPEIYMMNADGTRQKRLTFNKDGDTLPSWSPSGKVILITGYREGNYEIIELRLSDL